MRSDFSCTSVFHKFNNLTFFDNLTDDGPFYMSDYGVPTILNSASPPPFFLASITENKYLLQKINRISKC